jgi:hypothetical protein
MKGFDTTKLGADVKPNYFRENNYSLEDVLKFVGIFHDDKESWVFVNIDGSCASVQLSCVLVLWPKIP